MLAREALPFEVRASTSESRAGGGHDQPDFALYDGHGDYLVVSGEVKLPSDDVEAIAFSKDRNDQIGRYLAQTGVVIVSNVRGFGLLTARHDAPRTGQRVFLPHADLSYSAAIGLNIFTKRVMHEDGRVQISIRSKNDSVMVEFGQELWDLAAGRLTLSDIKARRL